MVSHLQSHVTRQPRGHETNQKRYISTFIRPTGPERCRVVAQDEEISSTKSHHTSTTWSRDKSKKFISLLSQGLWTPNLAGCWLKLRGTHPQSHVRLRYRGHVTNKKRYTSIFTRPTDLKLCRVVAQDEDISSTKSHDTSTTWSLDKSKIFISLLSQGLWNSNIADWWLKMRGFHPQSHVRLRYRGHGTNKKRYISAFTRSLDPKLSQFMT